MRWYIKSNLKGNVISQSSVRNGTPQLASVNIRWGTRGGFKEKGPVRSLRWGTLQWHKISILVDTKISVVPKCEKKKLLYHWGPSTYLKVETYSRLYRFLIGALIYSVRALRTIFQGGPVSSCWPCWLLNPPLWGTEFTAGQKSLLYGCALTLLHRWVC